MRKQILGKKTLGDYKGKIRNILNTKKRLRQLWAIYCDVLLLCIMEFCPFFYCSRFFCDFPISLGLF